MDNCIDGSLMSCIAIPLTFIQYFFTRERVTEETAGTQGSEKKALPTGEQAKICLHDKFWIIMMVFFFLYQFGGMIKNMDLNMDLIVHIVLVMVMLLLMLPYWIIVTQSVVRVSV